MHVMVDNKVKRTTHDETVPKTTFFVCNMQISYALRFSKLSEVFCTIECLHLKKKKQGLFTENKRIALSSLRFLMFYL